jgi:hypothetical protein
VLDCGAGEHGLSARATNLAHGDSGHLICRLRLLVDEVAQVIEQGRLSANATREPPALTAEGIVGGMFAVLHTRLLEEGGQPLTDLLGSLMSTIVLPYLGATAAGRELSRPA